MAVGADNPIKTPADDALGREPVAHTLAGEIRVLDASEGAVVAVMGPWGSGKTSLINLIRHDLAQDPPVPVLDFNPWMFSGAEQLVESFFVELASQLRLKEESRLGVIAAEIEAYGELLSPLSLLPFVGGWIDRIKNAAGGVKKFQDRRKESVTARRERLGGKLAQLERPIVVVIDDIDRLQTAEIRDIFKLVRLTASFPNVIYVLAFDRRRVELALSDTGLEGRSYLEKIVQVPFDVPAIPEQVLLSQIGKALSDALTGDAEPRFFDEERWPDVLAEIVWPLIKNMRDVRRYAAGARTTMRSLASDVEAVDLLGLEAVRIFAPDVFTAIVDAQDALTATQELGLSGRGEPPGHRASVERILKAAEPHEGLGRALVARLFPAGLRYVENNNYGSDWLRSWLRARMVAHPYVLKLYLERIANSGMAAFSDAERAFTILADEEALDAYLRSINPDRLEDVIAALETFEGTYPVEAVTPATVVLLNLIPSLPKHPRGFGSLDVRLVVARVVLRLLRQVDGPIETEQVVADAIPRLDTLSSRLELVRLVGHAEGSGHKLVSVEAAQRLEAELAEAVDSASPAELAKEWDLLRLLLRTHPQNPDGEPMLSTTDDPELNKQVLVHARTDARSRSMGNRAVRTEARLAWDALTKVYGDEEQLRRVVESLEGQAKEGTHLAETVALAKRYVGGWRPAEF